MPISLTGGTIHRYESTCSRIKSPPRWQWGGLHEAGQSRARQIVRCSRTPEPTPRVILHCSSTSIFKSAPPPSLPCATLRVLFLSPFRVAMYRYKSPGAHASSPSPSPWSSTQSIVDPSVHSVLSQREIGSFDARYHARIARRGRCIPQNFESRWCD